MPQAAYRYHSSICRISARKGAKQASSLLWSQKHGVSNSLSLVIFRDYCLLSMQKESRGKENAPACRQRQAACKHLKCTRGQVGYTSGMRNEGELIIARRWCDDEREESCHEYRSTTRRTRDEKKA